MAKRETVRVGPWRYVHDWCEGEYVRFAAHDVAGESLSHAELTLLRALLRARKRLARARKESCVILVPRLKRKPVQPYTLKQAQRLHVCRLCGMGETEGPGFPFVYHYGKEHAHEKCLKGGRHAR